MNTSPTAVLDVHVAFRRMLAVCIDLLILAIIMFFINGSFGSMHVTGGTIPTNYTTTYMVDWPWYVLVVFAYFFIQEAHFSATIGKRLLGLQIVDRAGQPIALRAALLRTLLRFIDALPCFFLLGGLIMFLTPQRQRIGDLVAQTFVVRRLRTPVLTGSSSSRRLVRLASTACLLLLLAGAVVGYFVRPGQVIAEMRLTHQAFFDDESMTNFTLGNPTWGVGTVRYPVHYQDQVDGRSYVCQGEIAMNFLPPRGWGSSGSYSSCQAVK